ADYPADGGDGDDEPSDDDDDDDDTDDEDPEEEPFEEDDEEEEHLAPADSPAVPIVDLVLSSGETEALEANEPIHAHGSPISIPLFQTRLPGAARQPGPTESNLRRYVVKQAGYEITDTWDEIVDKMMEIALTTL
nr:hypothetical protein [Tanacetum cinerariifolium]